MFVLSCKCHVMMRCPTEMVDVASLGIQFLTFSGVGVPPSSSSPVSGLAVSWLEDGAVCCSVLRLCRCVMQPAVHKRSRGFLQALRVNMQVSGAL